MRSTKLTALLCLIAITAAERGFADEDFSLVINPFTGAAELRNDGADDVAIDGYFVTSAATPLLDPESWSSLSDSAILGWSETFSETGNRLGELNLFESLTVPAGESVAIGNPYTPFAPSGFGEVEPGLRSLNFQYTLADDSVSRRGDIEFSARNTVVLVVDPDSGDSMIQNQSGFDIDLDSYLVKSVLDTLDAEGWAPLSTTDDAWLSAGGSSNRIGEGNLFGSTALAANGGALPLGSAVNTEMLNDERDLVLEFTTADSASITGGVLFRSLAAVDPADCNGDGVVDIQDANCTSFEGLEDFLAGLNPPSLLGDTDGNGIVEFPDFLTLSGNFDQPGGFTDGDSTGDGLVGFEDFLTLSGNFGQTGAVAAVPEPGSLCLLILALLVTPLVRKRS